MNFSRSHTDRAGTSALGQAPSTGPLPILPPDAVLPPRHGTRRVHEVLVAAPMLVLCAFLWFIPISGVIDGNMRDWSQLTQYEVITKPDPRFNQAVLIHGIAAVLFTCGGAFMLFKGFRKDTQPWLSKEERRRFMPKSSRTRRAEPNSRPHSHPRSSRSRRPA